jgi:6-phosphogluconolactonase
VTRLTTCLDAESVARRAAALIERETHQAREQRGSAQLALSGGSTPGRTYELLGAEPHDWSSARFWLADERCVGPEDEDSNFHMANETLLRPAGIADADVRRMEGELGPEDGARRYAAALAEEVPAEHDGATLPALDLIVLGIGPDGHVASLFPGAPTLEAGEEQLCLGVRNSPKPPPERITLSLSVLRAARHCLLIATGAGKADAVSAMLAPPTPHVPASLLRRDRLTVIVDDAAAPPAPHQ